MAGEAQNVLGRVEAHSSASRVRGGGAGGAYHV
jgi:hypothetical protein